MFRRTGIAVQNIRCLSKMPKKSSKSSKGTAAAVAHPQAEAGIIRTSKSGTVLVDILAKPGAKSNAITGLSDEGVGVQIAAPPQEGEANAELLKYLSKVLHVRKSDITLEKGGKSRNKTVSIEGLDMESVRNRLQEEAGKS